MTDLFVLNYELAVLSRLTYPQPFSNVRLNFFNEDEAKIRLITIPTSVRDSNSDIETLWARIKSYIATIVAGVIPIHLTQ